MSVSSVVDWNIMPILGKTEQDARHARVLGEDTFNSLPKLADMIISGIRSEYIETGAVGGHLSFEFIDEAVVATDQVLDALSDALKVLIYQKTKEDITLSATPDEGNSFTIAYRVSPPYRHT